MGKQEEVKREQWNMIISILKENKGIIQHEELQKAFGYTRKTLWMRLKEMEDARLIATFKDGKIKYIQLVDIAELNPEEVLESGIRATEKKIDEVMLAYDHLKPEQRATVLSCLIGGLSFDYYNLALYARVGPQEYREIAGKIETIYRDLTRKATAFMVQKCGSDETLQNHIALRLLQFSYQCFSEIDEAISVQKKEEDKRALR